MMKQCVFIAALVISYSTIAIADQNNYSYPHRATDNSGNSYRVKLDYSGLNRPKAIDDQGNVTRLRPDGTGRYKGIDQEGNIILTKPNPESFYND